MDIRSEDIRAILRIPFVFRVRSLEMALRKDDLSDMWRRVLEQDLEVCRSKCKLREATLHIQSLQREHTLAVETLLQLKSQAGFVIKEQRRSKPKNNSPASSAVDGQQLSRSRPQSSAITFLLSMADLESSSAHDKLIRRIKHLQHELQGVERVCVHGLAGQSNHQPKPHGAHGRKGFGKRNGKPQWRSRVEKVDRTSVIHRHRWAAQARGPGAHVEFRVWDAGWAGHAINHVAELVGIGAINQVWLVLRHGCVQWLQAYGPHLEGLDFASVTPATRYTGIVCEPLVDHDALMLVQYRWDPSKNLKALVRDFVDLKQHLDSIHYAAVDGFDDAVEWSLANSTWAHEPRSLFGSVSVRHKVVFSMASRRELRLCLIGGSTQSIHNARKDLSSGGQAAVSLVEYADCWGRFGAEQWINHVLGTTLGWKVLSELNSGIVLQCDRGVRVGAFSDFQKWFLHAADGQQEAEAEASVIKLHDFIADREDDHCNMSILEMGSVHEVVKEIMMTSQTDLMTIAGKAIPWDPWNASSTMTFNDIKVYQYMPKNCEVAIVLCPCNVLVIGRKIIVSTLHALSLQMIGKRESEIKAGLQMICKRESEIKADALVQSMSHLMPDLPELVRFVQSIPDMYPSDFEQLLPVAALRFSHHTVNGDFAFGEDHENRQESILKLFLMLFQGRIHAEELDPLYVFLHEAPHGSMALYSRNNRRLLALQMLQACRRDVLVHVPCFVYSSSDERQAPAGNKSLAQWFAEGYDGADSSKGCNGKGLSIWSRSQRSNHRGYPIMNPAETTILALNRLCERSTAKVGIQHEQIEALEIFRRSLKKRQVQDDEETLSLSSAALGSAGKGKGGAQRHRRRETR